MQHTITSELSRLDLHDSSFEKIIRQNQEIELTFDWAKLTNFIENNINEPIIIGKTILHLTGVNSEQFRVFPDDGKCVVVSSLDDFYNNMIVLNEIDKTSQTIKIGAVCKNNDNYDWVEWHFGFATCKISWTSHVTRTEWTNGKLPNN